MHLVTNSVAICHDITTQPFLRHPKFVRERFIGINYKDYNYLRTMNKLLSVYDNVFNQGGLIFNISCQNSRPYFDIYLQVPGKFWVQLLETGDDHTCPGPGCGTGYHDRPLHMDYYVSELRNMCTLPLSERGDILYCKFKKLPKFITFAYSLAKKLSEVSIYLA